MNSPQNSPQVQPHEQASPAPDLASKPTGDPTSNRAPPSASAGIESPYKSTGGPRRVWNALHYSMRGLVLAWRVESAFRQEVTLAAILIPTALILPLASMQQLALIGAVMMVLIIELINSSIEAAVDRISLAHHRLAGRAKDLGSAAVMLALLLCLLTWALIAGPLLVHFLFSS